MTIPAYDFKDGQLVYNPDNTAGIENTKNAPINPTSGTDYDSEGNPTPTTQNDEVTVTPSTEGAITIETPAPAPEVIATSPKTGEVLVKDESGDSYWKPGTPEQIESATKEIEALSYEPDSRPATPIAYTPPAGTDYSQPLVGSLAEEPAEDVTTIKVYTDRGDIKELSRQEFEDIYYNSGGASQFEAMKQAGIIDKDSKFIAPTDTEQWGYIPGSEVREQELFESNNIVINDQYLPKSEWDTLDKKYQDIALSQGFDAMVESLRKAGYIIITDDTNTEPVKEPTTKQRTDEVTVTKYSKGAVEVKPTLASINQIKVEPNYEFKTNWWEVPSQKEQELDRLTKNFIASNSQKLYNTPAFQAIIYNLTNLRSLVDNFRYTKGKEAQKNINKANAELAKSIREFGVNVDSSSQSKVIKEWLKNTGEFIQLKANIADSKIKDADAYLADNIKEIVKTIKESEQLKLAKKSLKDLGKESLELAKETNITVKKADSYLTDKARELRAKDDEKLAENNAKLSRFIDKLNQEASTYRDDVIRLAKEANISIEEADVYLANKINEQRALVKPEVDETESKLSRFGTNVVQSINDYLKPVPVNLDEQAKLKARFEQQLRQQNLPITERMTGRLLDRPDSIVIRDNDGNYRELDVKGVAATGIGTAGISNIIKGLLILGSSIAGIKAVQNIKDIADNYHAETNEIPQASNLVAIDSKNGVAITSDNNLKPKYYADLPEIRLGTIKGTDNRHGNLGQIPGTDITKGKLEQLKGISINDVKPETILLDPLISYKTDALDNYSLAVAEVAQAQEKVINVGKTIVPSTDWDKVLENVQLDNMLKQINSELSQSVSTPTSIRTNKDWERFTSAYNEYLLRQKILADARQSYIASLNPSPIQGTANLNALYILAGLLVSEYIKTNTKLTAQQKVQLFNQVLNDLKLNATTDLQTKMEEMVKSKIDSKSKTGTKVDVKTNTDTSTKTIPQTQTSTLVRPTELTRLSEAVRTAELENVVNLANVNELTRTRTRIRVKSKLLPIFPELSISNGKASLVDGSIVYRKGLFWKVIPPPWNLKKPITLPKGIVPTSAKNINSTTPEGTIQVIGKSKAVVPATILIDDGIMDVVISNHGTKIEFFAKGEYTNVGKSIDSNTVGMSINDEYAGIVKQSKTKPIVKKKRTKRHNYTQFRGLKY